MKKEFPHEIKIGELRTEREVRKGGKGGRIGTRGWPAERRVRN